MEIDFEGTQEDIENYCFLLKDELVYFLVDVCKAILKIDFPTKNFVINLDKIKEKNYIKENHTKIKKINILRIFYSVKDINIEVDIPDLGIKYINVTENLIHNKSRIHQIPFYVEGTALLTHKMKV